MDEWICQMVVEPLQTGGRRYVMLIKQTSHDFLGECVLCCRIGCHGQNRRTDTWLEVKACSGKQTLCRFGLNKTKILGLP